MADIDVTPEVVEIPLSRGYVAIVDAIDADLASHKWHAHSRRTDKNVVYGRTNLKAEGQRKSVYLHRLILARILQRPLLPGECCDHIDGNTLNNTRANLRPATNAENNRNRKLSPRSTNGYKGVYYNKQQRLWCASITHLGKVYRLGKYKSPEEAHAAYCEAAQRLHGEFARFE